MKVLILEDSSHRIQVFKKELNSHDLYFFDNVGDAINAVELIGDFEMYFLDHDLDDRVYVDSSEENTGYQFAKYLKSKNIKVDTIVHSMNSVGAQNIKNQLPHAVIVPFINLFK